MLDLGELISFSEAASRLPARRKGRPAHVGTLHRWRARGLRGVRLPARRVGGVWMTSNAALEWFVERLTCREPKPHVSHDTASNDALESGGW
jgi:hypothetical protein